MNLIHRSTSSWRATRSLLLAGLVAGTVAACSEPTALNQLPAGTITIVPTANMRAEDLSSDGTTILMTDVTSPTADFYFYDIATGTTTLKGRGRRRAVQLHHRHLERAPGQRHSRQAGKRGPLAAGQRLARPRQHLR